MARGQALLAAADVDEVIRAVLQRATQAVSAIHVHRALPRAGRPSQADVLDRLQDMTGHGTVHAWPGGRSPLFWVRKPEDAVRDVVLQTLSAGPQSEGALRKRVKRPTASLVVAVLDRLVNDGRVFRHPPLGKTKAPLYGLAPPDALRYLTAALDRVARDGMKLGFDEAQVKGAIARYAGAAGAAIPAAAQTPTTRGPVNEDAIVQDAILQLNPRAREGALVYVPHLRVALGPHFPEKGAFDRALLSLLAQGRIQLQAHPVPSQLSVDEREAMVPDGRGSFYMAAGLRQP